MDFKIGQIAWILGVRVDEFSLDRSPWVYPKTFYVEEVQVLSERDEDGFITIQTSTIKTLVLPDLLLHEKPDLSLIRFGLDKTFQS
jgi:hypothetical protein